MYDKDEMLHKVTADKLVKYLRLRKSYSNTSNMELFSKSVSRLQGAVKQVWPMAVGIMGFSVIGRSVSCDLYDCSAYIGHEGVGYLTMYATQDWPLRYNLDVFRIQSYGKRPTNYIFQACCYFKMVDYPGEDGSDLWRRFHDISNSIYAMYRDIDVHINYHWMASPACKMIGIFKEV